MVAITRNGGENRLDFYVRVCDNREKYGLSWDEVAATLNADSGENLSASTYRKKWYSFCQGRDYARSASPDGAVARRILSLSDFHVPFHLPAQTFDGYQNLDVLVINGDILDCQSLSKFTKLYRIPLMEEMVEARAYMLDLIAYINPREVVVTYGNHETRLMSYMANKLDADILSLMPDSVLELIINTGFTDNNLRNHTKTFYEPISNALGIPIRYVGNWWTKIGKAIFCHPLAYSSSMLKTSEKAASYFHSVDEDFDTICMAHTHKLGQYVQGGVTLIEQGCCCDTKQLDYADGKLIVPQQQGFAVIYQDKDGRVIANDTKFVKI